METVAPPAAPAPTSRSESPLAPFPASLSGSRAEAAAQAALRALWTAVIPALLAVLTLRDALVQDALAMLPDAGRAWIMPLALALFLLFASLVRYWRFRVPGGRHASRLPAHLVPDERDPDRLEAWAARVELHEILVAKSARVRETDPATFDARVVELGIAIARADEDAAVAAERHLRSTAESFLVAKRRRETWALGGLALGAAAAAMLVRAKVAEPYRVLSASMLPTLEPGDHVAGNRLAYRSGDVPARGDVVVFRSNRVALGDAAAPDILVKRVIGLPGDKITMRGGVPVINGWSAPYCDVGPYLFVSPDPQVLGVRGRLRVEYLGDHAYLTLQSLSHPFEEPFVVPAGEVFVLGDNRSSSLDSRSWNVGHGGGVPLDAIDARADWFLAGTHRSGDVDLERALRPLDTLARSLHVEGLDSRSVDEGLARCMATRPASSHPPPTDASPLAKTSAAMDGRGP